MNNFTSGKVPFTQIPNFIFDGSLGLSSFEISVYCNLLMRSKDGVSFPSHQRIADDVGASVASVKRAILSLADMGLLSKIMVTGSSNKYFLSVELPEGGRSHRPRGVGHTDLGVGHTDLGGRSVRPTNNTKLTILNNNIAKKERKKDLAFEEICKVCKINWKGITKSERDKINGSLKEIREAYTDEASLPAEIRRRAKNYGLKYKDVVITPQALKNHWGACDGKTKSVVVNNFVPDEKVKPSEEGFKMISELTSRRKKTKVDKLEKVN